MRLLKFVLRFLGLQYKEPLLRSFIIQLITTLIALEKCEKKKAICLRLFWYKVFDNGKLKLLIWHFPNGFHLKYNEVQLSPSSKLISYQSWKLLNRLMSRKQYTFFRKIKVHYFPDHFNMIYHFMGRFFSFMFKGGFLLETMGTLVKKRKEITVV